MTDYRVLSTPDEFLAAVDALAAGEGPVAVDAERASGFTYSQRAYLIQVYRRGAGAFLFDPPAIGRMDALQAVIGQEEWVLHAASQDLACLREVGLDPVRIFDTELAARLLGLPKVGLGAVVEDLLGIHLAKEHSAADWSTRPLPQSWLVYAAKDVELLVDLRDRMEEMLIAARKTRIAREEFEATLARAPKAVPLDPWRRLSGMHSLRGPRPLAVARELWLARDAFARERDIAPGRLIPDSSIIAVARNIPTSIGQLSGRRDFTGRASRGEVERWWAAIERGTTTEDLPSPTRPAADTLPPPRAWGDRNPAADARLKAGRAVVTEIAELLSLPVENLLTPELLRRVAWNPPEPMTAESVAAELTRAGARAWQVEATSGSIATAFVEAAQAPAEGTETPS
ncbi:MULTISPECIES: ribonuclease D [unclassified Rathayibacter]|uniref:ribonuclease D n=1 Tax=unclassified Rathayibacter TaxID=2609250 RepID=UPI000CE8BFD5|nr:MULTISPECIES: ribonuclease D [unclassified Rathayibacter]PPF19515.1 ribonuclease D [Rathayibacter sp. AY1A4]PPG83970.1 ribonuclease D [Rathayibacter sp. AY1E5]PPH32677.1 ribonuclease D [Rathayibacter sp. AY1C3]PPH59732.1 ribonuclease D [Rathayibacter sp. AY1D7]PPI33710.1 ribonuclease D [Rathayibacter sp. AY1B4]